MWLFDGWYGSNNPEVIWDDLWHLDSGASTFVEDFNVVTKPSPWPTARQFHAAAFDATQNRMIIFGGGLKISIDGPRELNDTWVMHMPPFDSSSPWTQIPAPPAPAPWPSVREAMSAVWDAPNNRMVIFGGVTGRVTSPTYYKDVWALSFDTTPPATTPNVHGMAGRTTTLVQWTAPGGDGTAGKACAYDLRRSLQSITSANFASATPVPTQAPGISGAAECVTDLGLLGCKDYYYALKARDEVGNWSAMSNVLHLKTTCSGSINYDCSGGGLRAVPAASDSPGQLEFGRPTPNPASSLAEFSYSIPSDRVGEPLEIGVFDISGRRVQELARGLAEAGQFSASWNLLESSGNRVHAGVYYVRLAIGDTRITRSVIVQP
jgi:hypothetical protein